MKNKKKKLTKIVMYILIAVATLASGYFLYTLHCLTNIENMWRLIIAIVIGILWVLLLLFGIKRSKHTEQKKKNTIYIVLAVIYSTLLIFAAFNVDYVLSKIRGVTADYSTYITDLVTLSTNSVNDTKDISSDDKIGILNDESSYTGYILPKKAISELGLKNSVDEYDSFVGMIQDLQAGKIKYIFLPDNYSISFANIEGLDNLSSTTKVIYKKTEKIKETSTSTSSNTSLDKPFTILLMGVDSEVDGIEGATFNGDSLMVITFNPTTLSTTIVSIPRDTYTNITCFAEQRKNKITHAAWYGEDCMIKTIENLLSVDINYYVKINFKGVVSLVDALGGVDIDVPYSFCEQDSNRNFGDSTIYVKKGYQTLNGEQTLAFARNRHPNPEYCSAEWTNYDSDDFVRGQNQQAIIKAILNKLKSVRSVGTFNDILTSISNNMQTNLNTDEILSLYNVAKKAMSASKESNGADAISMQRLYISGYSAMIYDYSQKTNAGMKLVLYDFVPYQGSLTDVSNAMKANLNSTTNSSKTFAFNVDTPYEETIIGQGSYNEAGIVLLKDMSGMTETEATEYLKSIGLTSSVKYVASGGTDGMVIDQSIPASADINYIQSVVLTIVKTGTTSTTTIDCSKEENKTNSDCAIKTFDDSSLTYTKSWFAKHSELSSIIKYVEADTTKCDGKAGMVIDQSSKSGYWYDYTNSSKIFTITYCPEESTSSTSTSTSTSTSESTN
jgi:LCP family protein required for cell wall assembly